MAKDDKTKVLLGLTSLLMGKTVTVQCRKYRLYGPGDLVKTPSLEGAVEDGQYMFALECVSPEGTVLGLDWEFCAVLSLLRSMSEEEYLALWGQDKRQS